jgi:AcrR family transcriptional regulator
MVDTPTTPDPQRELILDAGFALFRQHGIRRVTMDELARQLRISKKTIYRHFPDKAAMVRACADRIVATVLPTVLGAFTSTGPVRERLALVMKTLSAIPRLVTPEFVADVRTDYPAVWEYIDARRHAVVANIDRLFADGVASGEVRPEINPAVARRVVLAILEQVMVPEVMASGEFTMAEAFSTISTMVTRGVLASGPATSRPAAKASRPAGPVRAARHSKEARR